MHGVVMIGTVVRVADRIACWVAGTFQSKPIDPLDELRDLLDEEYEVHQFRATVDSDTGCIYVRDAVLWKRGEL